AGAKKVIIPRENWQDIYAGYKEVEVIPMSNIKDVINEAIVSETVLHVNLENKDSAFGIMASPQMKA
ncbi:MAG: ATP-dependent protease LonB, partial [Clostridium sp.]